MRNISFTPGEFYHVYNRGADKRHLFRDVLDVNRFLQSMEVFNNTRLTGSLFEYSIAERRKTKRRNQGLVDMVAYCLNPNHFHFILVPLVENGISKFMKRLAGGYSWYFNNRHKRVGTLFQGPFQAIRVDSNEYLLHLSCYVNLNFQKHQFGDQVAKLVRSSWREYTNPRLKGICNKKMVLTQFDSMAQYKKFAENSMSEIVKRCKEDEQFKEMLLE